MAAAPGAGGQPGTAALNPVALAWAGNMAVAVAAGFGLHLTRVQAGAAETIVAAAVAVVTACAARPWYIPGITGAAAAALTAGAAFGLRWTPEQTSLAVTALSVVLMLATHQAVIPAAAARRGLTATQIQLARLLRPPPAGPAAAEVPHRPGQAPPLP